MRQSFLVLKLVFSRSLFGHKVVSSGKHLLQLTYFQYRHRFYAVTEYQSAQIFSVMNSDISEKKNKNHLISQGILMTLCYNKHLKGVTQIVAICQRRNELCISSYKRSKNSATITILELNHYLMAVLYF